MTYNTQEAPVTLTSSPIKMSPFSRAVLSIGRHKSYPYICFILVVAAYLYTEPFAEFDLRYGISFFGAITGLICVILMTRRSQIANYFGLLSTFGESIGNFLGGNIGAGLPHIYNFSTHVYGVINWRKNHDADDKVITRSLTLKQYLYVALAFILIFLFNIVITRMLGVENTFWQLILNGFIFGLAIPAQTLLMMRYDFSWYLWVLMNIFMVILNFFGPEPNPVIGAQYSVYLFNSLYGLVEWRTFARSYEAENSAV
ncbi:hypothetical protein GCM10007162_14190 [Ignatzschineria ureiclastica]|nr:nicotinamide riboside transporter PnuC [Ignatzschineria ureiclastica]GGZ99236.1 hypothetical protein GCM10007162_14190 [Ignatzschineria ureiclastica]